MEYLGQDKREGLGRKANSRWVLLVLLLLSGILILSSLYSAQASVFKKAREGVVDAASPILTFFAKPIASVNNTLGSIADYINVLEQNKALRDENAELRQWMNDALSLRETVSSFQALNTYQKPPEAIPIDAFVIGESNDAYARSMIVNAGRIRNVETGQAVIDSLGMVGRIVETGKNASRVLLLTDIQSRVPVYVEGADIEGILVGRTREKPSISFTQSSEPQTVIPGQRVLTSGSGGVLPRGLPVGEVSADERGEILVSLYANYARTRMVRVINYEFPGVDGINDEGEIQSPDPSLTLDRDSGIDSAASGADNATPDNADNAPGVDPDVDPDAAPDRDLPENPSPNVEP